MKKILILLAVCLSTQAATVSTVSPTRMTNYVHSRISTYLDTNVTVAANSAAANVVLGVNAAGTAYEYKTLTEGTGVTISYGVGTITIGQASVTSLADGSVGSPSLTFANSATTGLYRVGADSIGVSIAGVNKITVNSTATTVAKLNATALDTSGVLISGTYTPTLNNTLNIDASTAYAAQYMRVGNVVTVSGNVDIDPTAGGGTDTTLSFSVPIAADFTSQGGSGYGGSTGAGASSGPITANVITDTMDLNFDSNSTSSIAVSYTFTYLIP